jgi:SulP family sulfate permease
MASIIFAALKNMINFQTAKKLYHVSSPDFGLWCVAFIATAILGVTWGIAVSILSSVMLLLKVAAKPAARILGRLPMSENPSNSSHIDFWVDVKQFPQALELDGIKIFSFETSSLCFVNKDEFESKLKKMEFRHSQQGVNLDVVILDCSSITQIDYTSSRMLIRLNARYQSQGIKLLFANWTGLSTCNKILEGMELYHEIGDGSFYLNIVGAVGGGVEYQRLKREEELEEDGRMDMIEVMEVRSAHL